MVSCDNIALLVYAEASVSVAVISESDIETFFHDELLQVFDMSRSAVCIDIEAVRFIVNDIGLCAEGIEYTLRYRPCGAVRNVESYLDILEAELGHRDQVSDVAVTPGDVVYRASDLIALCHRHFHLSVDVLLYLQECLLIHLLAVVVDYLDTVVIVRVVRC